MEYVSQECYDQMVAELDHLINVELPKIKDELIEARAQGDLSENFEYHAAKRAHGRLLSKIKFKQNVLHYARVLDTSQLDTDTVGLFRKVQLTNLNNGTKLSYTIVNPHEANIKEGKMSVKTPVAEALLGKKAGDTVSVQVPAGILKLHIDSVTI